MIGSSQDGNCGQVVGGKKVLTGLNDTCIANLCNQGLGRGDRSENRKGSETMPRKRVCTVDFEVQPDFSVAERRDIQNPAVSQSGIPSLHQVFPIDVCGFTNQGKSVKPACPPQGCIFSSFPIMPIPFMSIPFSVIIFILAFIHSVLIMP